MKTLAPVLATAAFLLSFCIPLSAQTFNWEHLSGPEGGSVNSLARTPDGTLFATLDREGVYASTDAGASWTLVARHDEQGWSGLIHATRAGTLLLSGRDSTILRSTD